MFLIKGLRLDERGAWGELVCGAGGEAGIENREYEGADQLNDRQQGSNGQVELPDVFKKLRRLVDTAEALSGLVVFFVCSCKMVFQVMGKNIIF